MSSNIKLHELLSEQPYNLEKVVEFLERDHSSINEPDEMERITPLVTVLRNSQCSIEMVRLLLQFGADVNIGHGVNTPLLTALKYFRDESIVEALLRKGANIDVFDNYVQTPLCYIFTDCQRNQSINFEWKENCLNLLLQAGLDLNRVMCTGESHLSSVLAYGADVPDIELLLSKGGKLNACEVHATSLHCVTNRDMREPLKASVVQLLLDKQACEDEVFELDLKPLQYALELPQYEPSAIRLLLELSDEKAVNAWIRQTNDVLHLVVGNINCTTALVKLFLKRGACIDKLNRYGETVLHSFMRGDRKDLSVLEFLLKSGADVNVKSRSGGTPLTKAVELDMEDDAVKLLFAFGARFIVRTGMLCDRNGIFLLERAFRRSYYKEDRCVFKTLVKCYLLEFPNFNVQRLLAGHGEHEWLSVFVANCHNELHRMEATNVRSDCTLRRFLSENHLLDVKTDQETKAAIDDCNQLLKILSSNEFREYFDVMASKMLVSKVAEVVLEKLVVFSFSAKIDKSLGNASAIRKVVLVHDVVCKKLAPFLSDEELLSLIVAFYYADDLPYNNSAPKKRKPDSELCTKLAKR